MEISCPGVPVYLAPWTACPLGGKPTAVALAPGGQAVPGYVAGISDCSVYLVAGVGGKLSRPVYLTPHPPGYQSKIILLILLILNYLNVKMYQL